MAVANPPETRFLGDEYQRSLRPLFGIVLRMSYATSFDKECHKTSNTYHVSYTKNISTVLYSIPRPSTWSEYKKKQKRKTSPAFLRCSHPPLPLVVVYLSTDSSCLPEPTDVDGQGETHGIKAFLFSFELEPPEV